MPSNKVLGWLGAIVLGLVIVICLMHINEHFTGKEHGSHMKAAKPEHKPKMNVIKGTEDNDWTLKDRRAVPPCDAPLPCKEDLRGTPGADLLKPSNGWDWVNSQGGDDVLYGGKGMDQFYANAGDDRLIGGPSHDHLWGGDGDDYLNTSDGIGEDEHVEEVHGNQMKKHEKGVDKCVIDADKDGAIVSDCATLVIKSTKFFSGPTSLYMTKELKDAGESYAQFEPGTYHGVGE